MLVFFFIIFLIYYLFIGLTLLGWSMTKLSTKDEYGIDLPFASVVIAVRNEEQHIQQLLKCLSQQSTANNAFEIIIVDDDSHDGTVEEIMKFVSENTLKIRLFKNDPVTDRRISPKKSALTKGINAAKGEIIIMTDGDCWFDKEWLIAMISAFNNEKTMLVSGPVALKGGHSILEKMQSIEFSGLIGTTAAMIRFKFPLMCNGANLAFRKSAFYHVNGYHGNETISSGDDVFLMQKIHSTFREGISFVKDQRAIVNTMPQSSLTQLINQRKRWASKWNQYLLPLSWMLPVFLLIHYISFLAGLSVLVMYPQFAAEISAFILLKIIMDYFLLKKVMDFCKLQFEFWFFLVSELIYPFYVVVIGILVHFGKYQWKGRVQNV